MPGKNYSGVNISKGLKSSLAKAKPKIKTGIKRPSISVSKMGKKKMKY